MHVISFLRAFFMLFSKLEAILFFMLFSKLDAFVSFQRDAKFPKLIDKT